MFSKLKKLVAGDWGFKAHWMHYLLFGIVFAAFAAPMVFGLINRIKSKVPVVNKLPDLTTKPTPATPVA